MLELRRPVASAAAAVATTLRANWPTVRRATTLLAFVLCPLLVFPWHRIAGGLLDGGDDALENLPQLVYSARMLLGGEIFWTPDLWMGNPLLAEPEFAVLYPPRLLLLAGPPVTMFTCYVLGHFVLAEVGAYAYLRELRLGRPAAIFGAFAYANAGFMLGHYGHTMYLSAGAWTPVVLLLLERATTTRSRLACVAGAAAFAMLPFSGALQLSVYLASSIVLLGAARAFFERRWAPVLTAMVFLLPGLAISALQILPSIGFSAQLATQLRERNYEAATELSFHPVLLPTVLAANGPNEIELYTREGVIAVCAAAAALVGWKRVTPRSPILFSWAVLLVISLILMMGKHVPPVARMLHALPIVNVLRIPARHNFELGIAVAVLAAFGFENLCNRRAGRTWYWIVAGVVVGSIACLFAWGVWRPENLARSGFLLLDSLSTMSALGALLAFVLWLAAVSTGSGWKGRLAKRAVVAGPVLEAMWAMRDDPSISFDYHDKIEAAQRALPESERPARLLPRFARHRIDGFAGNTVLLHGGLSSVNGYSSVAYTDASLLLGLDMHGQPTEPTALMWSTLPSVFSVTHLVAPLFSCGFPKLALAKSGGACVRPGSGSVGRITPAERIFCDVAQPDPEVRFRIEAAARTLDGSLSAALGVRVRRQIGWFARLPLGELKATFESRSQPFDLSIVPREAFFAVATTGMGRVEIRNPSITYISTQTLAGLSDTSASLLTSATSTVDGILLDPQGEEASASIAPVPRVEQRRAMLGNLAAPPQHALEIEARTPARDRARLSVEVTSDRGAHTSVVFDPREIKESWTTLHRELSIEDSLAHGLELWVRGDAPVEIRKARLTRERSFVVATFPVAPVVNSMGVYSRGNVLEIDGAVYVPQAVTLPVRPVELRLDAEGAENSSQPIEIALLSEGAPDADRRRQFSAGAFRSRANRRTTVAIPPDARDLRLELRAGTTLQVHAVEAADACQARDLALVAELGAGLGLYRNGTALPRVYTAPSARAVHGIEATRDALLALDSASLGRTAFVETDAIPKDLAAGSIGNASFAARSVQVRVRSPDGPTLLVLNDRFDPSWTAAIDGAPAPIVRTNGLVRGVFVPRGEHRVEFAYVIPGAFWAGLWIAAAGVLFASFASTTLLRRVSSL